MAETAAPTIVLAMTIEARLARLAYELLDAHGDTARLASALSDDPDWQGHLRYLRDLQRAGRELLARTTTDAR